MDTFDKAIAFTLANEGGLTNDVADSGGLTKYGISKASYPDRDIANLTKDEAIEIYQNGF